LILDDITRAVLSRDEIARYLQGTHGGTGSDKRERIHGYLDELRTTQRYSIYRTLKHPLYPILRKISRVAENLHIAKAATRAGRVIYASNHRSHTDYLVEPLMLDENGVRPPIIAAGINLFGGPLGLIHRHVTGAIPIRRDTRDPAYLVTLKAYVAEIPTAVAYDLVLEDQILARQGVKRTQRPFSRELAEMVRCAVGYRSRAIVTFGTPIALDGVDSGSRRSVLDLAHQTMREIGRVVKVLPTALVATALRRSSTRKDLEDRVSALIDTLRAQGANLDVSSGPEAVDAAAEPLEARGIIVVEHDRFRVRHRNVLRYYARSIDHLLASPSTRTH
jgi:glycerol-3-phosphate O-acyltransferase